VKPLENAEERIEIDLMETGVDTRSAQGIRLEDPIMARVAGTEFCLKEKKDMPLGQLDMFNIGKGEVLFWKETQCQV
jgi:hypothetical protein